MSNFLSKTPSIWVKSWSMLSHHSPLVKVVNFQIVVLVTIILEVLLQNKPGLDWFRVLLHFVRSVLRCTCSSRNFRNFSRLCQQTGNVGSCRFSMQTSSKKYNKWYFKRLKLKSSDTVTFKTRTSKKTAML